MRARYLLFLTAITLSTSSFGAPLAGRRAPLAGTSDPAWVFVSSSPVVDERSLFHFAPLRNESLPVRSRTSGLSGIDFVPLRRQNDPAEEPVHPGFHNFHRVLAYNLTRGLLSADNLVPLAVGGGMTLLATPFDDEVSDALRGTAPGWGHAGRVMGSALVVASSAGAVLAVTPFVKSERFKAFSFNMAQSLILCNALTFSLKAAVPRTRPDGDGNNSFPSGHASNAFAWATVLAKSYGPRFAIPAYVVSTFIALSRVESGRHFLSDVIAGSTIGYLSGITALRGSKSFAGKTNWTLLPSVGPRRMALHFYMSF